MRKFLLMIAVGLMTAINTQAQKIEVVDDDGYGIPLVSVQTEDGVLIGTTDLNGVLADVKGAAKVAVSHVAYKPKLVTVGSLQNGRVVLESVDFGLDEVVVKPKPYLFVEYYYRAFSYIDDSLRVYTAGIIPVAHEIQNNYKGKTRNVWSHGGAANKALIWNTQDLHIMAEKGVKQSASPVENAVRNGQRFKNYYKVNIEPDGENKWLLKNPEGVVGHIVHDDGHSLTTIDGSKMQIYANKVNGEKKMAKTREEKNYTYQYTEIYKLDEEGKVQHDGFVMAVDHWEHDTKKGKKITILYLYATNKAYWDEEEFKARSKELNKGRSGDMSLNELAEYERAHNIPALSLEQQKAIQTLTKQTGVKKQ